MKINASWEITTSCVALFYFPMIDTYLPEWFPFWGGERFQFFRPVFNVADSAISVGVASILIFHRSYFLSKDKQKSEEKTPQKSSTEEE